MHNKEAMNPSPSVVISLSKLSKARKNLKQLKISSRRKKNIWAAMVFLFMGSLRGSEIFAPEKKKFDPAKTLMGNDIKVVKIKTGAEEVTTLQLTLKLPKTSKALPVQVVELRESKSTVSGAASQEEAEEADVNSSFSTDDSSEGEDDVDAEAQSKSNFMFWYFYFPPQKLLVQYWYKI